jgi:putative endonuclease
VDSRSPNQASRRQQLGKRGEAAAAKFLANLGYRIAARNYRCPVGEVDLIALDGNTVVFVEVKSRTSAEAADPEITVHREKRRRVTRAAKYFLSRKPALDPPCRFDVVAVVLPETGPAEVEHFIDAFSPATR